MIGSASKPKSQGALALLGFLWLMTVPGNAQILERLEREFAAVAADASECCVRVDVVKHVSVKKFSLQDGEKGKARFKQNDGEMDILQSLSGVLIDDQGYVVTLGDALDEISRVRINVYQGGEQKRYKAEVIGYDLDSNVGLLKIENPPPLKVLPLGDSDTLEQGAFVFGVGYTYNLGPSPSFSIGNVNATDRVFSLKPKQEKQEAGRKLIQTSLSIKPGETGGALIDSASRVVGVLLTSYSGADPRKDPYFSTGYTLAIPINRIKKEVEWIIAKHAESASVSSTAKPKEGPWLGLTASEITDTALRNQLKLEEGGVLISDIFPNDPADKAGILKNDVLIEWEGVAVKGLEHLRELVGGVTSGQKVSLVLIRQGEEVRVALDVGKY